MKGEKQMNKKESGESPVKRKDLYKRIQSLNRLGYTVQMDHEPGTGWAILVNCWEKGGGRMKMAIKYNFETINGIWLATANGYGDASKAIDVAFSEQIDQEIADEAALIRSMGVMELNGTKYIPLYNAVSFVQRVEDKVRIEQKGETTPDKFKMTEDEYYAVWDCIDATSEGNALKTDDGGAVIYLNEGMHAKLRKILDWYWDHEYYASRVLRTDTCCRKDRG